MLQGLSSFLSSVPKAARPAIFLVLVYMKLAFQKPRDNLPAPRMKYLKLTADTFEEERILRVLFQVIDKGGSIEFYPKDKFREELVCDFEGES